MKRKNSIIEMRDASGRLFARASWNVIAAMLAERTRPSASMVESTKICRELCKEIVQGRPFAEFHTYTIQPQEQ